MYRTAKRTYPARKTVSGPRANKFAGDCSECGKLVPAGTGILGGYSGNWTVTHRPASWSGSPVSGWYVNGCPGDTARLNAAGGWGPGAEDEARELAALAEDEAREISAQSGGDVAHLAGIVRQRLAMERATSRSTYAPVQAPDGADLAEVSRRAGGKYAYTYTGVRMTMSGQSCEDAPCCGCCD